LDDVVHARDAAASEEPALRLVFLGEERLSGGEPLRLAGGTEQLLGHLRVVIAALRRLEGGRWSGDFGGRSGLRGLRLGEVEIVGHAALRKQASIRMRNCRTPRTGL